MYSFQKLTQFSQGGNLQDAANLIHMGFFPEIYVFHELSYIGLFGTKKAYLHFGKCT
jgi:hypothetical protein